MSDMPRVMHATRTPIRPYPEEFRAINGDQVLMTPRYYTSYTLTDLVNKLVALSSRVVNDHGAYLNMNSGDDDLADMLAKAIAEIQGEGK